MNRGVLSTFSKVATTIAILIYAFFIPVNNFLTHAPVGRLNTIIQLFFTTVIICPLVYSVWNIDKLKKAYKTSSSKKALLPAIFSSVLFALLSNPFSLSTLSSFNRIVSVATISTYDISHLIIGFFILFAGFSTSMALTFLFFNYIRQKFQKNSIWDFFDKYIIVALLSLTILVFTFFSNHGSSNIVSNNIAANITPIVSLLITSFFSILFYITTKINNKISSEKFIQLYISIAIITFFSSLISQRLISLAPFILILTLAMSFAIVRFINIKTKLLNSLVCSISITSALLPIVFSAFIEAINILNQHDVIITTPIKLYRILLAILIIVSIALCFIIHKKSWSFSNWKKFVYPLVVIGFTAISVQLPLQQTYNVDLFETANSSVLVSDFLYYGKIPIVEHYGGHMLTGFFGGIFYGLLNQDLAGTTVSPYSVYITPILYILFYFFIKKICDKDTAFMSTLMLPFLMEHFGYYGVGIISIFAIINYFKQPSFSKAFLVDACVFICALYRLDLGVSFAIAITISSIIYGINKKKNISKFLLATVISVVIALIGWGILCLVKNINPILQLKQFLAISASNQNWSYVGIGDPTNLYFAWSYIVVPFFICSTLLYLIISKRAKSIKPELWLTLLILGIAYFANFSRGLVRHSLMEFTSSSTIVIWTGYLYIALFISTHKNKTILTIPIYIGLTLLSFIFVGKTLKNINPNPIINIASTKTTSIVQQIACYPSQKVQRVIINPASQQFLSNISNIITPLLNDNETFYDFTNHSFSYSYTKKPDPTYAVQTPGHLSGEFSQEMSIEELEKSNVSLVVMPSADTSFVFATILDGVPNSIRYYKLAEYIYQNYSPVVGFEDAEIWAKNDQIKEKRKTISSLIASSTLDSGKYSILEKSTSDYDSNYNLSALPLLWGEKDVKNASNNETLTMPQRQSNYFVFSNSSLDKESGNYLKLVINSSSQREGEVQLGNNTKNIFKTIYGYSFTIHPGKHTYLLRISHDKNWYQNTITAIKPDNMAEIVSIEILKGD